MEIAVVVSVGDEEVKAFVDSFQALVATFAASLALMRRKGVSMMAFETVMSLGKNLGGAVAWVEDKLSSGTLSTVSCPDCCPWLTTIESLMMKEKEG
jgi:hypothetical protein